MHVELWPKPINEITGMSCTSSALHWRWVQFDKSICPDLIAALIIHEHLHPTYACDIALMKEVGIAIVSACCSWLTAVMYPDLGPKTTGQTGQYIFIITSWFNSRLPRCGHDFHVICSYTRMLISEVDCFLLWLKSNDIARQPFLATSRSGRNIKCCSCHVQHLWNVRHRQIIKTALLVLYIFPAIYPCRIHLPVSVRHYL